jgi:hypothetical protein
MLEAGHAGQARELALSLERGDVLLRWILRQLRPGGTLNGRLVGESFLLCWGPLALPQASTWAIECSARALPAWHEQHPGDHRPDEALHAARSGDAPRCASAARAVSAAVSLDGRPAPWEAAALAASEAAWSVVPEEEADAPDFIFAEAYARGAGWGFLRAANAAAAAVAALGGREGRWQREALLARCERGLARGA